MSVCIQTSPSTTEKAKAFAKEVVLTINYSDSNQFDLDKIEEDHFISKIGEEAVRARYVSLGRHVTGPDYTIYPLQEKSWDDDLIINGTGVAVKTQKRSSARTYGLSWVFQSSSQRTDRILLQKEKWIIFVECNDLDQSFDCIVYPPHQVKELVFCDPKLPHLKGRKKVVYAKDLIRC